MITPDVFHKMTVAEIEVAIALTKQLYLRDFPKEQVEVIKELENELAKRRNQD